MSNLDDIFDLQEQSTKEQNDLRSEKKPRKKAEMSDEKKTAMLERLRAGREKRQENLKAKKQPKEEVVIKQPEVKKEKEVVKQPKIKDNKDGYEDEKLSFIKMMAGKSKPIEKVERHKKKVYTEPKEEEKQNKVQEEPKHVSTPVAAPIAIPIVSAPVVKVPVINRTFKKPIWA